MRKHRHPKVHVFKNLEEVNLLNGEILSVNIDNPDKEKSPHYFHTELWLTPDGKPIVFLPEGVEVKSFDEWNDEYKKHFE